MTKPTGPPARNRDAAAVLLTRGAGEDLEVFLVERAPELRFFGGYLALPGGVRDAADHALAGAGAEDTASLRWCGVRELFEETGVLLLAVGAGAARRRMLREQLLAGDASGWSQLAAETTGAPGLADVCRIRTPPFAPVRYDTLFVHAALPAGETPDIWPGELVGGAFWRPEQALAAWRRGEVLIVPPVLILLELLAGRGRDLAQFFAAAQELAAGYDRGLLHRVRFSPGVILASLETPTLPPATTTNCLVVGERRLWVVDPASPDAAEQQRLADLLRALQEEGRQLAGVLLTHHHHDHTGGALALCEAFGLRIRAHAATFARFDPGRHAGEPLRDGDRLPLGVAPDGSRGWQLEAVFTPGHAPGHLCFRESRYGALIAGDMISTVSTIVIDPPDGHMATYLQSLARLRDLEITTLYPAHGPAVRSGRRVVEHYIAHRAERQAKVEAALRRGPATVEQLVPSVYDDVDPRMYGLAARSLRAGLQMLAENGGAEQRDGVWHAVAASA